MKIACVGNMNNMMFPTARYLADEGHLVTLFLLDEFKHFLPSSDVFEFDNRIEIVELGWHHQNFYKVTSNDVKEIFSPFSFFIGTDYAPAYFFKARMTLDIFFPAGGDIFDYPFRKIIKSSYLPKIFQIESFRCAKYQKWALTLAQSISMDPANEDFEKYLKILKMDKIERIPALPFLYITQYNTDFFSKSSHYNFIQKLKKENDFLIIQHCRQSWTCDKNSLHYKANDRLIKGFALFLKNNHEKKCKLILLEYGEDVKETKKLIDELSINEHVIWLPKMLRKNLLTIIKHCNVGVGELGRSWFSYGAVYEILAMKIPFIGNRKDEHYVSTFPKLYPMYNAETEIEIFESLNNVIKDPVNSKMIGEAGYEWLLKYHIKNSIDMIAKKIRDKNHASVIDISLLIRIKLILIDSYVSMIVLLNNLHLKLLSLITRKNSKKSVL